MQNGSSRRLAVTLASILAVAAILVGVLAIARFRGSHSTFDGGTGAAQTMLVELGDFFIKPANFEVPLGANVTFEVVNKGQSVHNLAVQGGPTTALLRPGQRATLRGKVTGPLALFCSVPGHTDAGMKATVTVSAASAAPPDAGLAALR